MTQLLNCMMNSDSTTTENGAYALSTTGSPLLDLFSCVGGMRSRMSEVEPMFEKALDEDALLAVKLAFYTRDIRGGLGERDLARKMFHFLACSKPSLLLKNLPMMVEVGRYDDLVELLDTPVENDVVNLFRHQLRKDMMDMLHGDSISLLGKWLPSLNTSSARTRRKAHALASALGMTKREYRKTLASLRAYTNVVEVNMASKFYDAIDYEAVPSKALNKYRNAFYRNDESRYSKYLEDVKNGSAKIHASTLFPYDIVGHFLYGNQHDDATLEAQWNALPNYVDGDNRILVMADVSGSMQGRPMATSIGLAVYFAQRNQGPFHNKFMTFSARPELVSLEGETLRAQIRSVFNEDWEMNTNLLAAFDCVLNAAIATHCPQEELPTSIVIISDMEIDECTSGMPQTFYDAMKKKYAEAGYQLPNIVFWNVESRNTLFHSDIHHPGVQFCSGQSVSVFKSLLGGVPLTPYQYMVQVLNNPRYASITL